MSFNGRVITLERAQSDYDKCKKRWEEMLKKKLVLERKYYGGDDSVLTHLIGTIWWYEAFVKSMLSTNNTLRAVQKRENLAAKIALAAKTAPKEVENGGNQ